MKKKENYKKMIQRLNKHAAWSKALEEQHGELVAAAFVVGSELLGRDIKSCIEELLPVPNGTSIMHHDPHTYLPVPVLKEFLPDQFAGRYDLEFFVQMKGSLENLRQAVVDEKNRVRVHSVMQELIMYLIMLYGLGMTEIYNFSFNDKERAEMNEWAFNILGDMDLVTLLYSDTKLDEHNPYHFNRWMEDQFYTSK